MDTETMIVREILRQNEFLLRRHLVLCKTVLEQMKNEGLITEHSKRKIMLELPHRQVGVLIQSLEYKGLASLKKFLTILRQTGHGWMVDTLMDTDISMSKLKENSDNSGLRYRDTSAIAPKRRLAPYVPSLGNALDRKSLSAGNPSYSMGIEDRGVTLGSLLRAGEPPLDPGMSGGLFHARDFLNNTNAPPQPLYPELGQIMSQSNHPDLAVTRGVQSVPSTLYDLNQTFATQDQQNQQAMNVLQQEETAIRQLLEQNARDQGMVRKKQAAVTDIVHRLKDLHVRANAVYEPSPNANVGRYRLSQLNQIPWSIDR